MPVFGTPPLTSISAGNRHACGADQAGRVVCWGRNPLGQLGDGTQTDRQTPDAVASPGPLTSPSAHAPSHTCALTSDGGAMCWGLNTSGQLGDGTTAIGLLPVQVTDGHRFQTISVGFAHTCAVTDDGAGYCWGDGGAGQLGSGDRTASPLPVRVADPWSLATAALPSAPRGGAR